MAISIKIVSFQELVAQHAEEWCCLFCQCFGVKENRASYVLKAKYVLNDGFVGLLFFDNNLVASYSVITNVNTTAVGLSVDTMANGLVKGSTLKLADAMYPYLRAQGLKFLLGYPNERIQYLRVSKLGWEKLRVDFIYFGKLKSYKKSVLTFRLVRPQDLYFKQGRLWTAIKLLRFFGFGFGYYDELSTLLKFKVGKKDLCIKRFDKHNNVVIKTGFYSIDVP